ncbi:uncharacterized protein LOC135929539 isoform X2 [Gordionus sp. m RMFG-2023]|uniref:uncharacterized protein LOC135929539 isoform X2 n=1 Tax=Gordionus sp. m RMFG-2023 TaxID=3053472 RepID=UPI0031FBF379
MNLTSQKVNLLYSIIIFFKGSTGNYRLQNNGKKTKQGYKIMERKQNLNEEYSDVVFIVDGKRFHAHKFILASKSEYFRALLYGGMKKSLPDCNELELKDAPNQAFKTLLKLFMANYEQGNYNIILKSETTLSKEKRTSSPSLNHLPHQQQLFTANYEQGNYNIIFKNETTLSKEKRTYIIHQSLNKKDNSSLLVLMGWNLPEGGGEG